VRVSQAGTLGPAGKELGLFPGSRTSGSGDQVCECAAHAHAAVLHGATVAEAAEAIGVTFLMNGGPATVYGARAFAAFQEFHREYAGRRAEPSPAR
jgi:hypothetical protein